jgi:cobalt/nickel transport protein
MKRYQNILLLLAVASMVALPLRMVKRAPPGSEGKQTEQFVGSDDKARDLIASVAPTYKPWVKPMMEPAGTAVETLLFALQAALGAGFIGYYLGVSTTRTRMLRDKGKEDRC